MRIPQQVEHSVDDPVGLFRRGRVRDLRLRCPLYPRPVHPVAVERVFLQQIQDRLQVVTYR
ncbi:hypothetical protein TPA0598_01_03580 [Streptomyces lydicamycinicus]|uniref:Uncharacterized protein n=1 Tax=Streptomyces lydicamycinicus TaxID=1546107 RepID=A0A0N7YKH0_9ACTN|nr:hypothetical protein TPA0598_01_03580 [Streptomyces lydicamycinicus]